MDHPAHRDTDARRTPLSRLAARVRRSERGKTLIELLVVIPLMFTVVFAIYALHQIAVGGEQDTQDRAQSLGQQQIGMERMTREMRQAISITPISSQAIEAVTWVRPSSGADSVQRRVRYECTGTTCSRWEGAPGGSFTTGPVPVITGVVNPDVFSLEPNSINPTFVATLIEVRVRGVTDPVVLSGGFSLRNLRTETS